MNFTGARRTSKAAAKRRRLMGASLRAAELAHVGASCVDDSSILERERSAVKERSADGNQNGYDVLDDAILSAKFKRQSNQQ